MNIFNFEIVNNRAASPISNHPSQNLKTIVMVIIKSNFFSLRNENKPASCTAINKGSLMRPF